MIGHILDGKYQIARLLGEGGMGSVWEGVHGGTGRRVAIKIIKPEWTSKPEVVKRFYREARAVGAIDTPHVVQVYDSGVDPRTGSPYLVMEYLVGEDVSHLSERLGFIEPELALRIVAQGLVGLKAAHDAGVVHRDIKPSNLFLAKRAGGDIVVKVLDFGIAKTDGPDAGKGTKLTRTGQGPMGSPAYMSPEQAAELKTIDQRTDVWSMGAVLYECLTQSSPYAHCESLIQLYREIASGPPPPVQNAARWVPAEVAAVVHGAMSDRNTRFQSAATMLDAIVRLLPQGFALNEGMLTTIRREVRGAVAARLVLAPTKFAAIQGATNGGLSTTTAGGRRRPNVLPAAIAVGTVIAIAGPVAYWKLAHRAVPAADTRPTADMPPTNASASSSGLAIAPVPATRTVRVAIEPRDAAVLVDGAEAPAVDGSASVSGTLGSVHRVRVSSAGRDTQVDVVITETGALPATIALPAPIESSRTAAVPAAPPWQQPAKPKSPDHSTNF